MNRKLTPRTRLENLRTRQTLDLLGRPNGDMRTLVRTGNIERLRELFAREPELAKFVDHHGILLFWLPEDEDCFEVLAALRLFEFL